jgi:hypothetical protein
MQSQQSSAIVPLLVASDNPFGIFGGGVGGGGFGGGAPQTSSSSSSSSSSLLGPTPPGGTFSGMPPPTTVAPAGGTVVGADPWPEMGFGSSATTTAGAMPTSTAAGGMAPGEDDDLFGSSGRTKSRAGNGKRARRGCSGNAGGGRIYNK